MGKRRSKEEGETREKSKHRVGEIALTFPSFAKRRGGTDRL